MRTSHFGLVCEYTFLHIVVGYGKKCADIYLFQCTKLTVSERDMEKEHQYQIAKRRAAKEKANRPDSGKKKKSKSKRSPTEDSFSS